MDDLLRVIRFSVDDSLGIICYRLFFQTHTRFLDFGLCLES